MVDQTKSSQRVAVELFLLSLVSLYIELLVIRWMSADIRAFTVFRTFPLVTCFIGLGVGFALGKDRLFKYSLAATVLFVAIMKAIDWLGIGLWAFPSVSVFQWQNFVPNIGNFGGLLAFMAALVVVLGGPFAMCACIGSRLGVLFDKLKPLTAYCVNIAGAIAGSVLFVLLSYLGVAPWYLLILPALILLYFLCFGDSSDERNGTPPRWVQVALTASIPLIYVLIPFVFHEKPQLAGFHEGPVTTYWSPYQRIDVVPYVDPAVPSNEFLGLELGVNHAYYQYFFSDQVDPSKLKTPGLSTALVERRRQYSMPFRLKKPESVLVVGAGTGQNVGAALENGATVVDAVDIDPVILRIGKQVNPAYSSAKVNIICDDARHFFNVAQRKYDLIVFSFLDSHTVAGQGSSVRIDTYVYTRESIAQAMKLLKPGGVLVISFAAIAPWIPERLYNTMQSAAGYPPLVILDKEAKIWGSVDLHFLLGENVANKSLVPPEGWSAIDPSENRRERIHLVTDDWPYLYVQPDVVDMSFLLVLAEVLWISVIAGRRFLFGGSDESLWQMFFLGAAFLLMELHAISFLSLLYGSTWLTSAIVINGILIMILIANALVIKLGERLKLSDRQPIIYGLLIASILLSFSLPAQQILSSMDRAAACALLTTLVLLPIMFAGLIFASAFARSANPSRAIAFNLFGAVVGGLLEYLSNYTGIKSLTLLAAALYVCSFWCYLWWKRKP